MIVSHLDDRLVARLEACWSLQGVRAGSALVWWNGGLLAAQDDAYTLVRIDPASRDCTPWVLEGHGGELSKPEKPDFEAAFVAPDGVCYVLGSGSTPRRRRIARLAADGTVSWVQAEALYGAITASLGAVPNLEGAALVGDRLRLFHRGEGAGAGNATLDVQFDPAAGPGQRVLARQDHDLGTVGGVPLTFTDAAPLDAERTMYLAVAEDTPNAIDDGPVVGVAVGVIGPDGGRWALLTEADGTPSVRKAEGLAIEPGGRTAYLLTDPDDPCRCAELCRVALMLRT